MKKLKAREQQNTKCSYCSKSAVWTNGGVHACENHKVLLKPVPTEAQTKGLKALV